MGCFSSSLYGKNPLKYNLFVYFVFPNMTSFHLSRLNDPFLETGLGCLQAEDFGDPKALIISLTLKSHTHCFCFC